MYWGEVQFCKMKSFGNELTPRNGTHKMVKMANFMCILPQLRIILKRKRHRRGHYFLILATTDGLRCLNGQRPPWNCEGSRARTWASLRTAAKELPIPPITPLRGEILPS